MPPQNTITSEEKDAIGDQIVTLIKSLRSRAKVPDILYHYTDAAGLKGIIETNTLRAHVSFMNDSSEYLHASEILLNSVQHTKAPNATPLVADVLRELEDQLGRTTAVNTQPYFVTCFSAEVNDLNQWRAYARGEGGFAIGLSSANLVPSQRSPSVYLAPAIYEEGPKVALIQELLKWIIQEYPIRAAHYRSDQRDQHRKDWVTFLLSAAAIAAPIMKNPSFAKENEWRLISFFEDRSSMCFLPKPTGLIPYVEFHYDKLPIQVLWSGPGRMTGQSLLAGRALLEKHSYCNVDFEQSKIPYRVG